MLLKIRKHDAASFVLTSQDSFDSLGSFMFYTQVRNAFSTSVKNAIGLLVRIALNLQMAFGSIDILTILIFPIHKHGIPFHLFVSSSIIIFRIEIFHLLIP